MKKSISILFLAVFSLQSFSIDVLQYILSSNLNVEEIHSHDGSKDGLQKGIKKDSVAETLHHGFHLYLTALNTAGMHVMMPEAYISRQYFEISDPPPNCCS
ncbi:MAG: hypothetical protein KF746_05325 [Chitinophagaceae bacterium]|nr:hypothetical protein [Chitinophagaceae bacterium]